MSAVLNVGLPVQERYRLTGASPAQGHQNGQEARAQDTQEEAEGAGTVQPGEETAQGEFITAWTYLMGGCIEDGARLFSEVQGDRTRVNGHRLKHGKALDTRKKKITMRLVRPCNWWPEWL